MKKNIVLCGVGGQGTVLASKLIAAAAMDRDLPVMSAETIGMAQKGGSVTSFIRLGDGLATPMMPRGAADVIIGFEPAETVRAFPYLKRGGSVVVNTRAIMPVTAVLADTGYEGSVMTEWLRGHAEHLTMVDCSAACEELGSSRVANMVLLGAAVRTGELPVTMEDIVKAMKSRLRENLWEINLKALMYTAEK